MATTAIGTRVYNRGDRCNASHFGTVTAITNYHVEITPDADSGYEHGKYCVPAVMISAVDAGNGTTRIVTEAAHREFVERQRAAFLRSVGR